VTQYDIREQIPISDLIIGLKCGGSDGLSGITANPLVGAFSDKLISQGGSAILTEVPEMFCAETILMNRCKNKSVFKKTVSLINEFKNYYTKHGHPIYENPSPGNKAGGITTLEEKALGCTQKAGTAAVIDVLAYGEALHEKGLNLLESPGNDLVASTALAASGAHLILFTTGLGTPFGAPVPTIKISSNTALYNKKPGWIDFDAGPLAFGADIDKMANNLFSFVLELANGNILTKTEQNEIRDIAIFKNGVTL
jgi:altronate hydrolase